MLLSCIDVSLPPSSLSKSSKKKSSGEERKGVQAYCREILWNIRVIC